MGHCSHHTRLTASLNGFPHRLCSESSRCDIHLRRQGRHTGEHDEALAQERDVTIGADVYALKQLAEPLQRNGSQHHPHEDAVTIGDPTCNTDDPLATQAPLDGFRDLHASRPCTQVPEIDTISDMHPLL